MDDTEYIYCYFMNHLLS